jgi:ubiquinone/menaquinone biosynthesis C-methylase UbiE
MPENGRICDSHGLPIVIGDIYALALPENSIDAIVFLEVVEHLENPGAALKEIHRVLKPNGKLLMTFPNDTVYWWARMITFKFREARYDLGHKKQYRPGEMACVLEKAGFAVFSIKSFPFGLWPLSTHCIIGARKAG